MEDMMVITIGATGEVDAMHRDGFDIGFLGRQKITRASEIIFNEETQLWDVWPLTPDGTSFVHTHHTRGFADYNSGRKFEVALFEACALASVGWCSSRGIEIATELRKEFQ